MSGGMGVFYLALLLVLPIAALMARRLPLPTLVRGGLAWIVIFGALFLLATSLHFT